MRLRDIKFGLKTSTRTRSALKMVEHGVTWSWLTSIYFFEKGEKCFKVIQMYSFFACVYEIIKEILNKNWFPLYWVRPRIGDGRARFFVVLSHFNICLDENETKQKFYRKLKVNHINITILLFPVTDLIKGNNLFCNDSWQCTIVESWWQTMVTPSPNMVKHGRQSNTMIP